MSISNMIISNWSKHFSIQATRPKLASLAAATFLLPIIGAAEAERYGTCDDLQLAVRAALLSKKHNDDNRTAALMRDSAPLAAKSKSLSANKSATESVARSSAPVPPSAPAPQAADPQVAADVPPSAPPSAPGSAPGKPEAKQEKEEAFTNIQEIGVDEPDHVKVSRKQVFVLRGPDIQVAHRTSLKSVGAIPVGGMTRALKLLVTKDYLFVLGERDEQQCSGASGVKPSSSQLALALLIPAAHAKPGSMLFDRPTDQSPSRRVALPGSPVLDGRFAEPGDRITRPLRPNECRNMIYTVVQGYRLGEGLPTLEKSWEFKGPFADARLTASQLVLIFNQTLNLVPEVRSVLDNPDAPIASVPEKPIHIDDKNLNSLMSCNTIFRTDLSDLDFRLTKIVAINTTNLKEETRQAGFVGGGDQIYMSTDNLYIAKVGRKWMPGELTAERKRQLRDALTITKIGFVGQISVQAQSTQDIKGKPKDQWAFKELSYKNEKLLGIFTTTGEMWSKDPLDATNNYLWILKQNGPTLSVAAKLSDIAKGENIRSIRYIDNWAYAVTFKKTDPLFAIDLTDPLKPKIVGELKIPGFSTYMHPVGEGLMIGIGFDVYVDQQENGEDAVKAQGLKLSLFDVHDPKNLKELDRMIIGGRGSYSDVTGNHHAFFYDPKLKRLAFPATTLRGESKTEKWQTAKKITFAGAMLFGIEKKKIKLITKWRHNKWIPVSCYDEMMKGRFWEDKAASLDINRIYRVEDDYLTVSRFGLKSYGVRTPDSVKNQLRFEGDYKDCRTFGIF